MSGSNIEKKEINNLLKSVIGLIKTAKKESVRATTEKIKMFTVVDVTETRNQLITIITEEVCKHYFISIESLRFGRKYCYDVPRLLTYRLLYTHTDMTIIEIANYFNKTDVWVQRKLASFKKLRPEVLCDKDVLDSYDKIYKRILCRVASLNDVLEKPECDSEEK